MDIDKILDYVAIASVIFSIGLLVFALFFVGIAFFTVLGFCLVFMAGVSLGFFLAPRLLLLIFKN